MQDTRQMSDEKLAGVLKNVMASGPDAWRLFKDDVKTLRVAVAVRLRAVDINIMLGFDPKDDDVVSTFREFMRKVEVQDVD